MIFHLGWAIHSTRYPWASASPKSVEFGPESRSERSQAKQEVYRRISRTDWWTQDRHGGDATTAGRRKGENAEKTTGETQS